MRSISAFKIIGGIFILVIIGIIGGYLYLSNTKTTIEEVRKENGTEGGIAPLGDLPPITVNTNEKPANNDNPLHGEVPRLRKISITPVGGADIFNRKDAGVTHAVIRFVDRGTGNVYETSTSSLETVRVSNTTIPKINEAMFGGGGNSIILRYADQNDIVQTFMGKVSATSSELTGKFISANANPFVMSPSKNQYFYMTSVSGGSAWYISDLTNKPRVVFGHSLKGWQASWPNENALVVTTKPTSIAGGVSYLLNTKGGDLTKLFGPLNGLVVLPSSKIDTLLYSNTQNNTLYGGLYNIKNARRDGLSSPTIPDKCVWAPERDVIYCGIPKYIPSGEYPDVWYEGLISFNDKISIINPSILEISSLIDPSTAVGEEIDAIDLHLSSDENYLIFTNKKDLSLWGLRLD